MSQQHAQEVEAGVRFEFGKNWAKFLDELDDARIAEAERSLAEMLRVENLAGKTFLDIGSGSGLFSLAARRLGAAVHSFDFDPHSFGCTQELRRRYFPGDPDWKVEQGSALDPDYLGSLGTFDIVYSWGVLHHTGDMWKALAGAADLVAPQGRLFIALYNDQGGASRRWTWVKKTYNRWPLSRPFLLFGSAVRLWWRPLLKDIVTLSPGKSLQLAGNRRGMALWRDMVDWVGGYPFEVAKPEEIFDFYRDRGFVLTSLITDAGLGCNQFVFLNTGQKL